MNVAIETIQRQPARTRTFQNFGANGQGQIIEFLDYPRLTYRWRSYEGDALAEAGVRESVTWRCDGADCASFDEAAARMDKPPVVTAEDRAVLDRIPAQWVETRPLELDLTGLTERPEFPQPGDPLQVLDRLTERLRERGLIEYKVEPSHAEAPDPADPFEPGPRRTSYCRRVPGLQFIVEG